MIKNQNLLLKIYFDEKIKRCSLPADFRELRNVIIKSFLNIFLPEMFEVYYMDEEKDLIQIENDYDYENALLFLKQHGQSSLKITIKSPNEKLDYANAIKFLDNSTMNSKITITKCNQERKTPELKMEELIFCAQLTCNNCKRKFQNQISHQKHTKICEAVFSKKRIPFDSKKQRKIEEITNNMKTIKINKDEIKLHFKKFMDSFKKWKSAICTANKKDNIQTAQKTPSCDLILNYDTIKCSTCKRSFNSISIKKHSRNCFKITNKRKPFESRKQRILSLEHAVLVRRQEIANLKKLISEKPSTIKAKPKWKILSQKFRTIMRISRLLNKAASNKNMA